jgi:uncharacterized membrane protein
MTEEHMEPIVLVIVAWLLFAATHIGLATPRVRTPLIERLGELGFRLLYSAIAAATFTLLMRTYAIHAHDGPAGLGAFVGPGLRWVLWGVAGFGATLMVAGLVAYPDSPMEMTSSRVPRPSRLARITRHPFFAGLTVIAVVHTVLAGHATGTAFFGGLALVTLVGMVAQDRKLVATKGEAYAAYCRETSIVPFASILAGRTGFSARDVPVVPLAVGLLGAVAIRSLHPAILAWDGMAASAAVVGGAALIGVLGFVQVALRAGHGRALATAGAVLVLQVGLAHEFVGMRLYPDGPERLGGLVAWHAIGIAGIVTGAVMIGATLGMLPVPSRAVATILAFVGLAFVAADAVIRGGFHFFAATLVVGALLVRMAPDVGIDAAARR